MSIVTADNSEGFISTTSQVSVWLWPELKVGGPSRSNVKEDDVFVFQYWPETVEDSYGVSYQEKTIPGGSHPLFQWVGGTGREVSFTAIFTAELDIARELENAGSAFHRNPLNPSGLGGKYTVDVAAAVARLQSYLRPKYTEKGLTAATIPPQRLWLVMEGLNLGGDGEDAILTVLKSAGISYQACFPNGNPRYVEVSVSFAEVVQHMGGEDGRTQIHFIDRTGFQNRGKDYKFKGALDKVF